MHARRLQAHKPTKHDLTNIGASNGLLRQYFPKRSDLSAHTRQDLRVVQDKLNTRPRKTLGWQTPNEIYTAAVEGVGERICDI